MLLRVLVVVAWMLADSTEVSAQSGSRIRVLGTVQDGGLPHAACTCTRCNAARTDPSRKRHVASLGVIIPTESRTHEVYLVDATPDIRVQLDALIDVRQPPADRVDREPIDGVLLTHAHIGHYTGLAFFGFEAVHTSSLPVYCTERMGAFLRTNGPWSQLVEKGNIWINEGDTVLGSDPTPGGHVVVQMLRVPHRDEYSDTVGFILSGSERTVLYVPDTEPWRTWETPLVDVLAQEEIDIAILDGTFYSSDELPGRAVASIGHPLIIDTMELLGPMVEEDSVEVYFTHLNHSNPALDPESPEAQSIRALGFHVLAEGQEFMLSAP